MVAGGESMAEAERGAEDAAVGGGAGPWARPRLVVSRCLDLDACRYNGATVPSPLVRALAAHVELVPICPEVEVGLGVPRDPIRLVGGPAGTRLVQPSTGRDLTRAMGAFADAFLASLDEVDGFLLKSRSPSCGTDPVNVYESAESARPVDTAPGMFAAAVLERFPEHPVEHEGGLADPTVRDDWLTALFAMASLRRAREVGSGGAPADFHARHELVLMASSPLEGKELGRRAADDAGLPAGRLWEIYAAGFRRILARRPSRESHAAALRHAAGCFEGRLEAGEMRRFQELLDAYRLGRVPRREPLDVIRSWTDRFQEARLAAQAYLAPYPPDLMHPREPSPPAP